MATVPDMALAGLAVAVVILNRFKMWKGIGRALWITIMGALLLTLLHLN